MICKHSVCMSSLFAFIMLIISISSISASTIDYIKHEIDNDFDGAWSVHTADIDGDNDIDIVGAARFDHTISWWENQNSDFIKHDVDTNILRTHGVFAIDIDGDDDTDILATSWYSGQVLWYENDGNQNFNKHLIAEDYSGAHSIFAIDIDGDSDIDILASGAAADKICWWENDGEENFERHVIAEDFDGARKVFAADMDKDNDIDILGVAMDGNEICWWENDGSQVFTKHTLDDNFVYARGVYAIDLDSDNDIDVLGAGRYHGHIAWWENDGNQNFTKHIIDQSCNGASSVFASDFDLDGDIDIIGTARYSDDVAWWENQGNGIFIKRIIDNTFMEAIDVIAADLDGDNDYDVVGAASDDGIHWWENVPYYESETCDISIIPDSLPIVVPRGGSFGYAGTIGNPGDDTIVTDVWTAVQWGGQLESLMEYSDITLSAGQIRSIHVNQYIPNYASAADYIYRSYCGNVDDWAICDQDSFYFTVIAETASNGFQSSEWIVNSEWGSSDSTPISDIITENYPDPFNASANISFSLPESASISLVVYNLMGQKVAALVDDYRETGQYTVTWDAAGFSSGVYFYRLTVGDKVLTKRMTLLK